MARRSFFKKVASSIKKAVGITPTTEKKPAPTPAPTPRPTPAPKTELPKPKRSLGDRLRKAVGIKPKKAPAPKPSAPPKPSPGVAREMLFSKMRDMYSLQRGWNAPATSRRIDKMTDDQVYRALNLSENDLETAARSKDVRWAAPDDPNSNALWYHSDRKSVA